MLDLWHKEFIDLNMQTPKEIREIAWKRIRVAKILCDNGEFDDAFYMAGYSVELMLKAKICERFDVPNIFDEVDTAISATEGVGHVRRAIKTHDINSLLIFSGLRNKFLSAWVGSGHTRKVLSLFMNRWSENCRYLPAGYVPKEEVIDIIEYLSQEKGVLQWIDEQ